MRCPSWKLTAALTLAFCLQTAVRAESTIWPDPQWQVSTPEEQGMDSRALAALVEYGGNAQMDSLVVVRHGKIVAEAYYAPFKAGMKHAINSATKGIVGALVGIAIDKALVGGPDTPVLDLFPDRTLANVDSRKKAIVLQNLLDMTSGIDWTEPLSDAVPETLLAMVRSRDWPQFVLDRPMARQPGATFNYNSGNSHLISAILASKTGMSTQEFAVQHLFKPLGISDFRWLKDPQGIATGGYGLYLQTRDMAKIGYLYLNHGEWDGARLISRPWVDKVYHASVPMGPGSELRYADFWWTIPARKAYMAVGNYRQVIMVLPEIGVVAAMTGRSIYPIENVLDHLGAAVKSDSALTPDPQAVALLQRKLQEASVEKGSPAPASALAREISGKTYRLTANPLGLKEFTLNLTERPSYEIVSYLDRKGGATRKLSLSLGLEGTFSAAAAAEGPIVVSKASWVSDNTLSVAQRWLEEGAAVTYLLQFSGKKVDITETNGRGQIRTLTGETD